jgi:hypothetical protein
MEGVQTNYLFGEKVINMFSYKEVTNMYRGQKYIKLQNSATCK